MANEQNLKPSEYQLTQEEAKKGGINSGKARRKKKLLRECLEILLEKEITGKNGNAMTGAEAMAAKVFQQALKGDLKAFEIVRDTAGQKVPDKIMVAEVDQSVIDEVENMVNEK